MRIFYPLAAVAILLSAATATAVTVTPLSLNRDRGFATLPASTGEYATLRNTTADTVLFTIPLPTADSISSLALRYRDISPRPQRAGRQSPGLTLSLNATFELTITPTEKSELLPGSDSTGLDISIRTEEQSLHHFSPSQIHGSPEILLLMTSQDGETAISAGTEKRPDPFTVPVTLRADSITISLPPGAAAEIISLRCTFSSEEEPLLSDTDTAADCPLDGEWAIYDYDIDSSLLSVPAQYTLSLKGTPTEQGILYTATLHGTDRVKAIFSPSDFSGIWSAHWCTADGRWMSHGITMTLDSFPLITLRFEPQHSVIRLRRPDTKNF